jgi:hypothetical protein
VDGKGSLTVRYFERRIYCLFKWSVVIIQKYRTIILRFYALCNISRSIMTGFRQTLESSTIEIYLTQWTMSNKMMMQWITRSQTFRVGLSLYKTSERSVPEEIWTENVPPYTCDA